MKVARSVPVLMYHHVSPSPGLVTLTPENFADQMRGLAKGGYKTLGADEFAAYLAGKPVADRSIVLTFDDGYLDNWVYAHPVLEQYGFTALLFVATDWIKDGPIRPHAGRSSAALPATPEHNVCKQAISDGLSDQVIIRWSEIDAMRQAGTFEFHSHTHTHTRWDKTCSRADEKRAALAQDIEASRAILSHKLGSVSDHLCWPQGYFDTDYIEVAHDAGYRHLYTVAPGANPPGGNADHINRIVVKDKPASWLLSRLWIYRHPRIAGWYAGGRAN